MVVYVLCRNEIRNLGRCLGALKECGLRATVLDSGSTDGSLELTRSFEGVELRSYEYRNHCEAYNEILCWHEESTRIMVLDADMCVSPALLAEVESSLDADPSLQAVLAPVQMYWEGAPLRFASLYPPKPIAFRAGQALYRPAGHGEHLEQGVRRAITRERLVHDDRKSYDQVLANQWRYARELVRRSGSTRLGWRDQLRLRTPLMILLTPVYSLLARGGVRDGRAGMLYALDRLIAEALALRASLSPLLREELRAGGAAAPVARAQDVDPSTPEGVARTQLDGR